MRLGTCIGLGITLVIAACTEPAMHADLQPAAQRCPASCAAPAALPAPPVRSFADLAATVVPAVVNVSAVQKPGGLEEDQDGSPLEDFLRRFFEQQGQGSAPSQPHVRRVSLGSGFIVDPDGYVVTDNHVIGNADKITVVLHDNSEYPAKVIGRDEVTDLALLKIEAKQKLPSVAWGDSDLARVGDWVLAVGNPFGLGGTVSSGIISARGRDIHSDAFDDYLQIDAAINRGNSGGPAFNLDGQVIGINIAIYSPNGGSVGIGFALPANVARPVIEQLRRQGKVDRGWLGVQIQEVTPDLARTLGLASPRGALVAGTVEDGPGARAGIASGDVILALDHQAIDRARDLARLVAPLPAGSAVTLEVWRDRRSVTLAATLGAMPAAAPAPPQEESEAPPTQSTTVLGLELAPLTDQWRRELELPKSVKGVLIMGIADDSPFADLDTEPGDVIQSIDHQPVATPQQVAKALREARAAKRDALILVERNGKPHYVTLPAEALGRGRGTNG